MLDEFVQQDAKLQDELAPLEQKEKSKEQEKQRLRKMNEEEYERHSETLSNFLQLAGELKDLVMKIEQYEDSTNEEELASIGNRTETLAKKREDKLKAISRMNPELQQLEKAIEDQDAYKRNLRDNLDIISTTQRIKQLEKDLDSLKVESNNIEGHETVYDDFESLRNRQTTTGKAIARLEGRRGEILESIRSAKVRTSTLPSFDYLVDFVQLSSPVFAAQTVVTGVQGCRRGISYSYNQIGNDPIGCQRPRKVSQCSGQSSIEVPQSQNSGDQQNYSGSVDAHLQGRGYYMVRPSTCASCRYRIPLTFLY